ncbi:hypothetical protein [uncultured Chryseobacterium sp.]|uniref:hypothetical protein n=1 Tax=uncultured Chryseobacterium sp. TaxID=259322 RepID=UPI0025F88F5B|nr:hypothetical protein [uncultured Chryseobacterium sp.]
MSSKTKILIIIGSASENSSNQRLMDQILEKTGPVNVLMYDNLSVLPHFDTALTDNHTPEEVLKSRLR